MVVSSVRDVAEVPRLSHREAMKLAEREYGLFADLIDQLSSDEWQAPTSCPGWTVREIAGHVVGSMRSSASQREQRRQLTEARRLDAPLADALTSIQVAATASMSVNELRREFRANIGPAVHGRGRIPAPVRQVIRIRAELPVSGKVEKWSLGYLVDQVLTRDTWMHRSDIALATRRPFETAADHDGRLVELIVADWSRRHDHDFQLTLEGPAGGTFGRGSLAPELTADAEEFCRALSGRGTEVPLKVEVPF